MKPTTGETNEKFDGGETLTGRLPSLGSLCTAKQLHTKWLLAPSIRAGHQWVEKLVLSGHSVVNLHPTTVLRLALELVGSDLAMDGLSMVSRSVGVLIVDANWGQLNPDGYLGRLDQSAELSMAVFDSLLALRLAGFDSDQIESNLFESAMKAADIEFLLTSYETFLNTHNLVDEAEVLRRAIAKLNAETMTLGDNPQVLIPARMHVDGLGKRFVDTLHNATRIEHPAESRDVAHGETNISLLANLGKTAERLQPKNDDSVQLFRAVGEINEVREVLRRALAELKHLDEVEILHTDAETYIPLFFGTARRHFSEAHRPDGVPITFAEGIPTSLSRPGRALVAWLRWMGEGFPQRLLVEMIGEGLLNCGEDDDLSFNYLTRLFRPVGIGLGADQYLPKLDEQIKVIGKPPNNVTNDGNDNTHAVKAHDRKLKGFKALRKLTKQLLELSQEFCSDAGVSALKAAGTFLNTAARSVSEFDKYATEALVEQIEDRLLWLDRLGMTLDLKKWLNALSAQTRVLGSGPRPGHLHVAHVNSGGQSGRKQTFVVGLDDRRFPGTALQDPVLLDRERTRISPELVTSAVRLRHKIDELANMLSRLTGKVTLSWSCQDLTDDRETFPSSAVLSAYRLISGQHEADLEAVNNATAPPVSFAPTTAEKSLDESERWLWQLSEEQLQDTNQISHVEAFFPHLARGRFARLQQSAGFGIFNGYVPQAGEHLNPFAADGPVLSASALETAGRCPLAFFFRNGLKLYQPVSLEIDPDRWIDAAQFGSLLHEVFRRFMDELSRVGRRPEFERDHSRLAEILREVVEQWRKDVPPPNENAFRMQYWHLVRTSRIFLQVEEEFCSTSQPRFFEVALGLDSVAGGSPLDNKEPTSVMLPSGRKIRTRGQVDRVDKTGDSRYAIWDYKTGSGYGYDRSDPFRQGRRVQSVLYLRMIETAARAKLDPKAIVERFGYFFPSIRAHGLRIDWDAATLSTGLENLDRICALIEAGVFLATDNPDDCHFCDYASICHNVNQVTSHSRKLLGRDDLVQLNPFRELRRG